MKVFLRNSIVRIITWEARLVLAKYKPKIIAVTGSVGKTSTKDAIYTVLEKQVHVRRSEKTFNTDIGVPLTILGRRNGWGNPFAWLLNIVEGLLLIVIPNHYPKWLVLEVGIDRPGDIKKITSWLTPDIVVVTRLPDVPVHVEYFSSPEAVASEKWQLVGALREGGTLIYNRDDFRSVDRAKNFAGTKISYGFLPEATVRAVYDEILYKDGLPSGMRFRLEHTGRSVPVSIKGTIGLQGVTASLAASAVGVALSYNLVAISSALEGLSLQAGRMRLILAIRGACIIDDSYNSSPVSLIEALRTLERLEVSGKKMAILGDMLELGVHTMDAHKEAGGVAGRFLDRLFVVGIRARSIGESARDAGLSKECVVEYEESRRAGKDMEQFLREGDVVLVKGSQGMRMERAVEELMAEPREKSKLLVRQDSAWAKR